MAGNIFSDSQKKKKNAGHILGGGRLEKDNSMAGSVPSGRFLPMKRTVAETLVG